MILSVTYLIMQRCHFHYCGFEVWVLSPSYHHDYITWASNHWRSRKHTHYGFPHLRQFQDCQHVIFVENVHKVLLKMAVEGMYAERFLLVFVSIFSFFEGCLICLDHLSLCYHDSWATTASASFGILVPKGTTWVHNRSIQSVETYTVFTKCDARVIVDSFTRGN